MKIAYTKIKKYKYELKEDIIIYTDITGCNATHPFFNLDVDGRLVVKKGYKWDGVSGGMIDSDNTMIGGCVHDTLYQMIRMSLVGLSEKPKADLMMKKIFLKCGMSKLRAWYSYQAVKLFGASSCIPGDNHVPETLTLEC